MWARVATVQVKPGRMDELLKIYDETQRSVNQGMQGFQSARFLTDRNANTALAVTIWATERPTPERRRPQASWMMSWPGSEQCLKAPRSLSTTR